MIIKVCGMREAVNIRELQELKPDYMGFIFYPHSKRFVGEPDAELLASIDSGIKKTGVFVDEAMDEIADRVIKYNLDAVQLHGRETAEFCRSFRKFIQNMQTNKRIEIIKAFGISADFDFSILAGYEDFVDYYLFDTRTAEHGGSGISFDWSVLENYHGKKGYFLSGGLSAENIAGVKKLKDARLYGVDLNSKFETAPAFKDIKGLREVFKELRIKD
ncbi:MAG: phosphoribosylanthranilate isomerase [Daejeonella sp.]|uniref:phosphoribosylanthranilate isomerase n=1 Tax=Daejeonella sp. JGW-45 TaxID=3034148 RepID=UPI0023ED54B7|nr:phosphoribosylanthranilate isomerase [Daejeonella sp. JGW-45]